MSAKKTRRVAVNTTISLSSVALGAAMFFLLGAVFKTSNDVAKAGGMLSGFGVAVIGLSIKAYLQEVEDLPSTEYADLMKEVSGAIGHTRRTGTPEQCKAVMDSGTQLIRTAANGMAIANQADAILLQKQGQKNGEESGSLLPTENDDELLGAGAGNVLHLFPGRRENVKTGILEGDRTGGSEGNQRDSQEGDSPVGDYYGGYAASSNACQPDPEPEPEPRKRTSRRASPIPSPSPLHHVPII